MPLPIIPFVFALVTIAALPAPTHAAPPWTDDGSGWTEGVLPPTPIANEGVLPPMVDARTSARARANLAASRTPGVRGLLESIRKTSLGRMRVPETRASGLERLRALDDPGFLYAMPEVFAGEAEDVRRTVVLIENKVRIRNVETGAMLFLEGAGPTAVPNFEGRGSEFVLESAVDELVSQSKLGDDAHGAVSELPFPPALRAMPDWIAISCSGPMTVSDCGPD